MENSLAENKRRGSELLVKRFSFYFPAALGLGEGSLTIFACLKKKFRELKTFV